MWRSFLIEQVFYRNPDNNTCEDLGSRVRSYCDTGDVFCDVGSDPVEEAHGLYIENYKDELLEFVIGQYNQDGEQGDGSDSPEASSTPSPDEPGAAASHVPTLVAALSAPVLAVALM